MSVKATHGNVVVASFQLLSNTGTFQLDVHVFLLAAVHKSHGCTAVAQALAQALNVARDTLQSFIAFQVTQSKTTTSQSTLEAGQFTSQLQVPSAQSEI